MTVNEVIQMIGILKAAYPRMEQFDNDDVKKVWLKAFEGMDGDITIKATWACIKKYEFMPSIAQVIKEYNDIEADDKRMKAEINRFYEQARNYYPGSGEMGYGKKEFFEKARTPEQAERLYNAIIRYVNKCTDTVMDFRECITTITAS